MSANSIEVQLELVRFLSQLQELFRASEPKKSLCSLRLGNYAYLSRLPCEIRKGLQLLSLAFKKLYISPDSSVKSKENLETVHVYARWGSIWAFINKSALKAAFSPLTPFAFFPLLEIQKVKVNLQSKGRTGPTKRFGGFSFLGTDLWFGSASLCGSECTKSAASASQN